jgi:hypothetical protein
LIKNLKSANIKTIIMKIWRGHFAFYFLILSFFAVASSAAVLYVDLNGTNPTPPYSDWSTASTDIQSAIDASSDGDLILVTNGIYQTGGRVVYNSLTNRVVLNKAITLQSINGPAFTIIQGNSILGNNAVRCVLMISNSVISGFTLTNGGTLNSGDFYLDESGGGIWTTNGSSATVTNCVLIGNTADGMGGGAYNGIIRDSVILQNSAYDGGGVSSSGTPSLVTNCLVSSNLATAYGGAAWGTTLKNCKVLQNAAAFGGGCAVSRIYECLIVGNSASQLGGATYTDSSIVNCTIVSNVAYQVAGIDSGSFIENCIICDNTATIGSTPNYSTGLTFYNCCTFPLPSNGSANITNNPNFINLASADFHLSTNSPCINSGNNFYAFGSPTDLDGNARVVDRLVDIGAYENQTSKLILPYYWAQQYGLSLDGTIDSDGDGMNNWQEAVAGTNPIDKNSFLKILLISKSSSGTYVEWQSVAYKIYSLERSTSLQANSIFIPVYTNSPSPITTMGITDSTATNNSSYFYRLEVLQ